MKLTEHFSLEEFEFSSTAQARGIVNHCSESLIPNLKNLCEQVLEPLREHVQEPVIISSGYRCPQLNNHPEVRGATKSQHMTGEAADLRIPSLSEGRRWMEWLISNLAFDQCIMEHNKNKDGSTSHWIHVSYSRKHNRQTVISSLWKK